MNDLIQENNSNLMLLIKIKQIFISNIYQSAKVNDYLTVGHITFLEPTVKLRHTRYDRFFFLLFCQFFRKKFILWNTLRLVGTSTLQNPYKCKLLVRKAFRNKCYMIPDELYFDIVLV